MQQPQRSSASPLARRERPNAWSRRERRGLAGRGLAGRGLADAVEADGEGPRVVILGAGFAGLTTARHLLDESRESLRITVVDRHNYHTFQPLLYQVATSGLEPQSIGHGVRGIFQHRRVDFRMGLVVEVDLDARRVAFDDGGQLDYDYLIVATGADTADYGIDGVAEHAFPLKSLPESVRLRNHILAQFERAESDPSRIEDGALTFVVVGGGPTGVELSGAIAELTERVLSADHPNLDLARTRVVLVEMLDTVLAVYSESSQRYTIAALEERGVEVRLGTAIDRVGPDGVELSDGEHLPAATVVWTAGVRANALADVLGLEQGRGGRIVVDRDLRVPGHPEVFAIGDIAGAADKHGDPLPQLAPVAIQQGKFVAKAIPRLRGGFDPGEFRYFDKGTMATIGRNDAVAQLPVSGLRLHGFVAWLAWLGLHIIYLIGFRNRAIVLMNWAWNYITFDRAARLILDQGEREAGDEVDDRHDELDRSA